MIRLSIVTRLHSGLSCRKVAALLNTSRYEVSKTAQVVKEILTRWDTGAFTDVIAKEMGVGEDTVLEVLQIHGLI